MDQTTKQIITILDTADWDIERIQRELRQIQQDLFYIRELVNKQEPRENEAFLDAIELEPVQQAAPTTINVKKTTPWGSTIQSARVGHNDQPERYEKVKTIWEALMENRIVKTVTKPLHMVT